MKSEHQTYPVSFTPESLPANLVFCVPIYQRLFAWGKKQVEKLLDDLLDSFVTDSTYYLGILTVADRDNRLDLIDGQQRMTVTILMAIAFMELCQGKKENWEKTWGNYYAEGKRLIFIAREEDSAYISTRVNECESCANPMMEAGINIIKSWCNETFKTENGQFDRDRFDRFSEHIWTKLTFFCSYLPNKYVSNPVELNRYFEAMNSTGRQLQQHEILLVELVNGLPKSEAYSKIWKKISDINKRYIPYEDNDKEYVDYYYQIIKDPQSEMIETICNKDDFGSIEQIKPKKCESGRTLATGSSTKMIISFEELLLMALRITTGGEHSNSFYKPELLLTRFSEANLNGTKKIDEFFENLLKCRLILDYKIIWQETDGNFDYELLTSDKGMYLEKFQSMLHVSNANRFYRWLPEYVSWLLENDNTSECDELNKLKNIDRTLHPEKPDKMCYPNIDNYWFWRLDYELWAHRDDENGWLKENYELNEVVKRYVFRMNRSIEHLHPQTPTDQYSEKWEGNDLHRFGNLAMISSSFNSQQSNDSAGVKMERVHHQIETSQIQSLKMLHMWIMYRKHTEASSYETWTKDKVDIHERIMLSYLSYLFSDKSE